jgi:DNA-binding GntR family transcriptional regulator
MKKAPPRLPVHIARQIVARLRRHRPVAGERLVELKLAAELGVSRSPVREALRLLETHGVARLEPHRGYVVGGGARALARAQRALDDEPGDASYLQVAADRLAGRLPEAFTEADLMRRYGVTRARLGVMLARMAREGWIERKAGYGWKFLPTLASAEAHQQSYRFRMAIEPAAILEPTFHVDRAAFARLRAEQQALVEGRIRRLSAAELFEIGSRFHETIVGCCGNPLFSEALQRVDRLRRLIEYRAMADTERFIVQAREHLTLLDLLEAGERERAAEYLRRHLEAVGVVKSSALKTPARRTAPSSAGRADYAHF